MELAFKALADPSRRSLLDRLFERDGQTLSQLCAQEEMTRFGVMKHLRVLEGAGLVTTRRVGRVKFHYLNPVPIRLIHDRWITKYAAPWAGALGDLKRQLEEETMSGTTVQSEAPAAHDRGVSAHEAIARSKEPVMSPPRHVYEVYIRTTPEKLWAAITRPDMTRHYYYANEVESDWEVGSPVRYKDRDGKVRLDGQVLEIVPQRRLVTTFSALYAPETSKDRPSRVTWDIEPRGEVCKLTLTHEDFDDITETYKSVGPGWNLVLSGLKTLLETGQPLMRAQ